MKYLNMLLLSLAMVFFASACIFHPATSPEQIQEYLGMVDEDSTDFAILSAALAVASGPSENTTTTTAATKIVMFSAGKQSGNFGGISGANSICDAHTDKPSGTTGYAFLSTNAVPLKDLSGVDVTLPVVGPTDIVIGTNWADLWDDAIANSLFDAGVMSVSGDSFWSGTDAQGDTVSGNNCSDWASSGATSAVGESSLSDAMWIDHTDPPGCGSTLELICVAW